eukprot:gene6523-3163_t
MVFQNHKWVGATRLGQRDLGNATWTTRLGQRNLDNATWATQLGQRDLGNATWTTRLGQRDLGNATWTTGLGQRNLDNATWATQLGQRDLDNATWATQLGQRDLGNATWTTRLGQRDLGNATWTTRLGQRDLDNATWTTRLGQRDLGNATWTTRLGQRDLDNATWTTRLGQRDLGNATWTTRLGQRDDLDNATWAMRLGQRDLGNATWTTRLGQLDLDNATWATRLGQRDLGNATTWTTRLGQCDLGNATWATQLGQRDLGNSTWTTQLGQRDLDNATWATRLGQRDLGNATWATRLGQRDLGNATWTTPEGTKVEWGNRDLDKVYGEKGWCNSPNPIHGCGCYVDGFHGDHCELRYEMICLNQCSGHGECWLGFCKCHEGWYGTDCARKIAGTDFASDSPNIPLSSPAPMHPYAALFDHPDLLKTPPNTALSSPAPMPSCADLLDQRDLLKMWQPVASPNTALSSPAPMPCADLLDQRDLLKMVAACAAAQSYLIEMFMQREHRTFDPNEADYFFVPVLTTCLIFPVFAWADQPWYYGPQQLRPLHAANMLLEVKRYIQKTYPFWNRRQGKDHIWLSLHDEGACWFPKEVYDTSITLTHWGRLDGKDHIWLSLHDEGACWFPKEVYDTSIMLTHWGRLDIKHKANTAYEWDNYSRPMSDNEYQKENWHDVIKHHEHPCYTPGKDLVIPSWKWPQHYKESPLMGGKPRERDVLMYFKHNWTAKHNIMVGFNQDLPPGYGEWLTRSKFCLVAPGDGWSARAEDCILHGSVPVVIMDEVHAVYESILDWDQFSIRISEASIPHLPEVMSF